MNHQVQSTNAQRGALRRLSEFRRDLIGVFTTARRIGIICDRALTVHSIARAYGGHVGITDFGRDEKNIYSMRVQVYGTNDRFEVEWYTEEPVSTTPTISEIHAPAAQVLIGD